MANLTKDKSRKKTAELPASPNADLFRAGKRYTDCLARLRADRDKRATARDVAAECGVTPEEVMTAMTFVEAVDTITDNCSDDARTVLLSEHPKLTAKKIRQIANTHPERQRFALGQVRVGRDPLGKPAGGTDPPFDTLGYPEVLSRLARNAGLLDHVADGLLATPRRNWPGDDVLHDIRREAGIICTGCRRMSALMKKAGGRPTKEREPPRRDRKPARSFAPASAGPKTASVRGITGKNARDLPRLVRETPPSRPAADAVLDGIRRLRRSAERLAAVTRVRGHDLATGPSVVPGTYVTIFHLPRATPGVRIGGLGTFDFPAGYYAYLGSAFGGGGVRKRTHRHLTVDTPRKWNIDHLKPLCTPVAVWWTHDRRKVEFDWAAALAGLPGASIPARRFGAADNPAADAHLVWFDRVPSFDRFVRAATALVPDHAPAHRVAVDGWTGHGWPT